MADRFIFIEETSTNNVLTNETRNDIVDRINNLVLDLSLDDEDYKIYFIDDITNDNKIIEGINNFIGIFVKIEKENCDDLVR